MKYLKIQNAGELDIRLVALMGGTTKASDSFKIGQFGTGLKYTLAYLLRNNLDFKIFVGETEVSISVEIESIRGEDFQIICINGHRTSITTRMGADWQAWMIIRELWCNALDEGDASKEETEIVFGTKDTTTFFIQIDTEFRKVINNWSKYFRHDVEPIFQSTTYALYPAGDHLCIYKQGVLIYENEKKKSVFGYDCRNAAINELRQLQCSANYCIASCLYAADEKAARYFLENVTDDHYEGSEAEMDYNWFGHFNDAWKDVIGSAKLIYRKAVENIQALGNEVDMSDKILVPYIVYKALTQQIEGVGALRVASKASDFYESYDPILDNKIQQGLTILEACDYALHPELVFKYGFFENKKVLAQVNLDQKTIYISNTLLQQPLFTIVAVLIEENEHFNTGMQDHTREFQQHFINLYTRALLAKNEVEI